MEKHTAMQTDRPLDVVIVLAACALMLAAHHTVANIAVNRRVQE
jgi:hypothetical protein